MTGQQLDIRLRKPIKAGPFWQDIPDQFMVLLNLPFLKRGVDIAVEDSGPLVFFQGFGV